MNVIQELKSTINNWWIYLILGILFILGSFYVYTVPAESYLTLSIFFAAFILIDGIGSIALALSNSKTLEGWGWQLATGIISTLVGIGLLMHPSLSMTILPLYVGFWIVMKGSLIIGTSFDLKSHKIPNWGWVLFMGIVNTLLGMTMILNPIFGASMIIIFTSISLLMIGITMIMVSLRLRKIKKKVSHIKETAKDKLEDLKQSIENYIKEKPDDLQSALKQLKSKLDDA